MGLIHSPSVPLLRGLRSPEEGQAAQRRTSWLTVASRSFDPALAETADDTLLPILSGGTAQKKKKMSQLSAGLFWFAAEFKTKRQGKNCSYGKSQVIYYKCASRLCQVNRHTQLAAPLFFPVLQIKTDHIIGILHLILKTSLSGFVSPFWQEKALNNKIPSWTKRNLAQCSMYKTHTAKCQECHWGNLMKNVGLYIYIKAMPGAVVLT